MVLVLLATAFEVFVQRPLTSMEQADQIYKQDGKLDSIWMLLVDSYSKENEDRIHRVLTNVKMLNSQWVSAGNGEPTRLQWQSETATKIAGGMFVLGGAMLVFAKGAEFREASEKNA